jgi:non-specific serine/threonine protein kinase
MIRATCGPRGGYSPRSKDTVGIEIGYPLGTDETSGAPQTTPRHNLPAPRTSFVGREREIEEIERELETTRLLTLTGAGGCGKTRLALQAARDLVGSYTDGVWFVELAPLSEEELVAKAVARALDVPERPGGVLIDALADALRDREMLLLMDNCEHLVEAAARLVDLLLEACPRLRVLATSREALGVEGELRWRVPPLSVPGSADAPHAEELEAYESVRLFAQRARGRDPSFALGSRNAGPVAEICRTLEGVPLALELAAARVGTLSLEHISRRLEGSLELLTGGARTAAGRQRTLRGALDWSHELLSDEERLVFGRLSAFAGGWTLEASEHVASGDGVQRGEVLDLLSALVEKSLVVAAPSAQEGLRYRLLEPVRQYALERLEEGGEARATRYRHASFFLALAEDADPALEGPEQPGWLDRLDEEHDNIRAALSWLLEQEEGAEMALRMCAVVGEYWYLRGHLEEGRMWLEGALAKPGRPSSARARALQKVAWLAILQGDLDRAQGASEEGLGLRGIDLFRTGGGGSTAADLKIMLAIAVSSRGEFDRAIELLDESLALSREVGSFRGSAVSLFCIGGVWRDRGDIERALPFFEEALATFRKIEDPSMIASVLTHLGTALLLKGDIDRARIVSEEAETMLREQNHRFYLVYALTSLGWVALVQNDANRTRTSFTEGLELSQEIGAKEAVPEILEGLACFAGTLGEAHRAATLLGAAQAMREATGLQQEPSAHALEEAYLSAARSRLNEESWEAAFEVGQAMSLDEAAEYAMSVDQQPATLPSATESPVSPPASEYPAGLTAREVEVLSLVARGLTSAQIAKELFVSPRTVHTHLNSVYHKIGVNSRSAATRYALKQGLA